MTEQERIKFIQSGDSQNEAQEIVNSRLKKAIKDISETGTYYTPSVSDDGDLSWTNNGGLDNPPTKNINGKTPTIGENGNWFIDSTDTHKPSRGESGPAGIAAVISEATAEISSNTPEQAPDVKVTTLGENTNRSFHFNFKNLKGNKGDKGDNAKIAPSHTAQVDDTEGPTTVTITSSDSTEGTKFDFKFNKIKGSKGEKGEAATLELSVDPNITENEINNPPTVSIENLGTANNANYKLHFNDLKGDPFYTFNVDEEGKLTVYYCGKPIDNSNFAILNGHLYYQPDLKKYPEISQDTAFDLGNVMGPAGEITSVTADNPSNNPDLDSNVILDVEGDAKHRILKFHFYNIKGKAAKINQATAEITNTIGDIPQVTVDNLGDSLNRSFHFKFDNLKGKSAKITDVTGSVSNNAVGQPSVVVTPGGTDFERTIDFNFKNLKGEKGDKGDAATIKVNSTTTGAEGTKASVSNSGTNQDVKLDFTIPKGDQGKAATLNISVDSSIEEHQDNRSPSVSLINNGDQYDANYQIKFSDLKGDPFYTFDVDENGELLIYYCGKPVDNSNFQLNNDGTLSYIVTPGDPNSQVFNLGKVIGPQGPRGFYFTPTVDDKGNLSWSNNGSLTNPATKNITGPQGKAAAITSATAEISNNVVGTPEVKLTTGGTDAARTFHFDFKNLKGEKGDKGNNAKIAKATASIDNTTGIPAVDVTTSETASGTQFDFAFSKIKGDKGDQGLSAKIIGVTASIDNAVGTPSVKVTPGGDDLNRSFHFDFKNLKGLKGDAATITVNSTLTSAPGTKASVSNSGTTQDVKLDFVIPRGDKGETGNAATIAVKPNIVVIEEDNNLTPTASVKNLGDQYNANLEFQLKNIKGDPFYTFDVDENGELQVFHCGKPVQNSNFSLNDDGTLSYVVTPGDSNSTKFDLGNVKGWGICAQVLRSNFTDDLWKTYGTKGHSEYWSNSSTIRNDCRTNDLFIVTGTATDSGRAYILFYRSTTDSGDLQGDCLGSVYAEKGAKGDQGISAKITGATASVDSNVGTPDVQVVSGGDALNRSFHFNFKNLKGKQGDIGKTGPYYKPIVSATGDITWDKSDPSIPNIAKQNIKGPKGDQGIAATLNVGNTITSAPGQEAKVSQRGTPQERIFDFTIPRGNTGNSFYTLSVDNNGELNVDYATTPQKNNFSYDENTGNLHYILNPGDAGTERFSLGNVRGPRGYAATLNVGNTTTGAAGTQAKVSQRGTPQDRIFDFTIPKGDTGDTGSIGPRGYDFNYQWKDTQLGVKNSNQTQYQFTDLKGATGEQGPKGDSLQYKWNGTSLGIKTDKETIYNETDLKGEQGIQGKTGKTGPYYIPAVSTTGDITWNKTDTSIPDITKQNIKGPRGYDFNYQWKGTELGVKNSSQVEYQFTDLKGATGEQGPKGDSLQYKWNGTSLGIKTDKEASYKEANLKGETGKTGPYYKPVVSTTGDLSWDKTDPSIPDVVKQNIRGPRGYDFNYQWKDTQLGVKDSSQTEYNFIDLKGATGEQGPIGKHYKPNVNSSGLLSWTLTDNTIKPADQNIKGPGLVSKWEGNSLWVRSENDPDVESSYIKSPDLKGPQGEVGPPSNVYDGLDSTASNLALSAKQGKILNEKKLNITGGTINGPLSVQQELKINDEENFNNIYIKRFLGEGNNAPVYADIPEADRKGTYRLWKIKFPKNCNFWGKVRITLYGGYSSFNASGTIEKEIICNFNQGSIYSNIGSYVKLAGRCEKDFRISEAIWNAETAQWEFWIFSKMLSGNNRPRISIEFWCTPSTTYVQAAKGVTLDKECILTKTTKYNNVEGNAAGQTIIKDLLDLPVFQTPYGKEIADKPFVDNIINNVTKITNSDNGFSAGTNSNATSGGGVGWGASTTSGGAIGDGAKSKGGFSGGHNAKSWLDNIQLGAGENKTEKSLQVYNHLVMNADGTLNEFDLASKSTKPLSNKYVQKNGDTISGDLTITGNLTVQGTETTLETQTVSTKDNIISLAAGRESTTPITGPVGIEVANYKGTAKTGQLVFKNDGIAYVGDSDDLQPLATRGNVTTGDLITWDDSKQTLIPVSTSFPILKPLYFKNCNGLIVNSNNKDVKVWEVMDDSNYASHYGFYELYNGAGGGNDNSLQLYADNQNGANKLVREVKQDGTVYYKTPVHVEGAAGDHNLISRGICGSNDNGLTTGELYLNYHVNNPVFFGSDANSTLDANGGITVNGPGVFKNTIHAYRYTTNNNAPFITFDKPGSGAGGIGSNGSSMTIQFGSVSSWNSNSWDRNTDDLHWRFRGDVVTTTNLNIKDKVTMEYNSTDDCLEFVFK